MLKKTAEVPVIITAIFVVGLFYLDMGHGAVRQVQRMDHIMQQNHTDLDIAEHELSLLQHSE